jgi:hypothetical protein
MSATEKPERSGDSKKVQAQKPPFKRKHPRVEMEIPAEVFEVVNGASGKPHQATVGNLGPEGAFVKSDAKIEQGGRVRVVFKLSSHPLPLDFEAEVRWARDGAGGGLGICFLTCPMYERAAIDDFCQQRIEDARGGAGGGGGD